MQLADTLETHFRLSASHMRALSRLHITTISDILYHFPHRYEALGERSHIGELVLGNTVTLYGSFKKLETKRSWKRKTPISEGVFEDGTGTVKVMWFHQPYIAKMYPAGLPVKVTGVVTGTAASLYIANPEITRLESTDIDGEALFNQEKISAGGGLFPVYAESKGVTSRWFYHAIKKIFESGILETINDPLEERVLHKYSLPSLRSALVWMHTPQNKKDASAARKRFAFEEVFFIQLARQQQRHQNTKNQALQVSVHKKDIDAFVARLPYTLTKAQEKAIAQISDDFKKPSPMGRLLEGDVGSGKTAVAAATIYAVATNTPPNQSFGTLQCAYMAPTEILARQQFETLIEYFKHLPIQIALITGSGCQKFPSKTNPEEATKVSKPQLLKWVANGEITIVVGTHALIQTSVQFKNLAYVIIDEQHRFGTAQRQKLARKDGLVPHLLSMTATPIPRTLALTIYGDLDLTLLDEMPAGRKSIITKSVTSPKRNEIYEIIRKELSAGRQLYVICPRINEPDPEKAMALRAKSVTMEAERLRTEVFPNHTIEILHSKMKPKEKDEIMLAFASHDVDILVATSVVEVGVNVPNATNIIIEGAERFGLAQLHQLRGRVLRSTHQAYCYLFSESKGTSTRERLSALTKAKSGFELAEYDLSLRGSGELSGGKQWGISDIGMEAIRNIKMVEAARSEALALIKNDPELARHPTLKELMVKKDADIHFE